MHEWGGEEKGKGGGTLKLENNHKVREERCKNILWRSGIKDKIITPKIDTVPSVTYFGKKRVFQPGAKKVKKYHLQAETKREIPRSEPGQRKKKKMLK
jgi:hypothetical protein